MWLRRRTERGASAVEFALVLPFLLLLVFGLIQYGLYFWALQGGSDLARGAARTSAVGNANTCSTLTSSINGSPATRPAYASTMPTVKRTYADAETANAVVGQWEPGDKVTVTVTFNAIDMNFPFVPFINNGVVTQTANARVERIDGQPTNCS